MKKKYLIPLFLIVFFVMLGFAANAQETEEADFPEDNQSMYGSGIMVKDTKIVSQEGSKIKLAFDILGSEFGQSQVKYSIDLVKKGQFNTSSQQVFDDILYVEGFKKINKEIDYIAPAFLSGSYQIWLTFSNEKGNIFEVKNAGEITLSGSGEYVEINNDSCYLTVQGEAPEKKYNLRQGVDISKDEDLNAVCTVKNNYKKTVSITPNFQTYYRTIFGEKVSENKQATVTLNAGEEKIVSLVIPKSQKPQAYDAVLSFSDEKGNAVSNEANFHYVVQGLSATIQDIKLDKDNYKKGEVAKLGLKWTGSADSFSGSRKKQEELTDSSGSIELEIFDKDGKSCTDKTIDTIETESSGNELIYKMDIEKDCAGPKVVASIKDEDGSVLDKAGFLFVNKEKSGGIQPVGEKENKDSVRSLLKTIIILLAVIALITIIYIRSKKEKSYIRIIIFLTLIGGMLGILGMQNKLETQMTNDAQAAGGGIPVKYRMCGYKGDGTVKKITVDGKRQAIDPLNDVGCCRKEETRTNKKTGKTKEVCVNYIFKLAQPASQPAQQSSGRETAALQSIPEDPWESFEMHNTNPAAYYNDHFDMYASTGKSNFYSGEKMMANGKFVSYRDGCMNASPAGYYFMEVTQPNISGFTNQTKEIINKPNGGAYGSGGYYELVSDHAVALDIPKLPRSKPPYYTASFHGKVYIFPDLGCYSSLNAAKSCAQQYDSGSTNVGYWASYYCDHGANYYSDCKKYEATMAIPFAILCNDTYWQQITVGDMYGDLHAGDSYQLKCNYGKTVQSTWVSAKNRHNGKDYSCSFVSIGTAKVPNDEVTFQCTVPTTAIANDLVTNTCMFPEQAATNYTCAKESSKSFHVSACICNPNDPDADEVCTTVKYKNDCGILCDGKKDCTSNCDPYPLECPDDVAQETCIGNKFQDTKCQNFICDGKKDCSGWTEIAP